MQRDVAAVVFSALLTGTAYADLNSATAAYDHKDFPAAAAEYTRLATQGDPAAQYNLSLMLANGQTGKRDLEAALGWALAAQDNGLQQATGIVTQLRGLLSPLQIELAQQYQARYGQASLKPAALSLLATSLDAPLSVARLGRSYFPDSAAWTGTIGWVKQFFIVDADGRVRDSWTTQSVPPATFNRALVSELLDTRFAPPTVDGKGVATLSSFLQKFTGRGGESARDRPQLIHWLRELRTDADNGKTDAQTILGMFGLTYPELSPTIGASEDKSKPYVTAVDWLSKAATAGNASAQFELGSGQLLGSITGGAERGVKTLMGAANNGSGEAALLLAVVSQSEATLDGEVRALRWLRGAAKSGYGPAIERLANLLASSDHVEVRDAVEAENQIKRLRESRQFASDPDVWQISAAAAAGRGDFREAMQFEDQAISEAKRLEWRIEPLQRRRRAYETKTTITGSVLPIPVTYSRMELPADSKRNADGSVVIHSCSETPHAGSLIPSCSH
jgi:TPR repeat protein